MFRHLVEACRIELGVQISESKATPSNPSLYARVKSEAKRKFKVYPSAYANGWIVKEYKKRGGTYGGSDRKGKGLDKWFKEKWVNLAKPKKGGGWAQCGRSDSSKGAYPKCVPEARAKTLSHKQIKSAIQRKRAAEKHHHGKKPVFVKTVK